MRHWILARFAKKNAKNQVFERSEFRQFLAFLDKHACVKKSARRRSFLASFFCSVKRMKMNEKVLVKNIKVSSKTKRK